MKFRQATSNGSRRSLTGDLRWAALPRACLLGLSLLSTAHADRDGSLFAEPHTGRPVTRYTVELPMNGESVRSFRIPDECAAVTDALERRDASTGRVLDRRLWHKVGEDCWFHAFLHRHPFAGIIDHVSDYDFMNARLTDLPIDYDCAPGQASGACQPDATNDHGVLRHFPLSQPATAADDTSTPSACTLRDGVFYGQLYVDGVGVHCEPGEGRPSLRLIAVDYADINGDGYLDAVLRFSPVGRGGFRGPLILPLTRTSPDGAFHTPPGAMGIE